MSREALTPVAGFEGTDPAAIYGLLGGKACRKFIESMAEQEFVGARELWHEAPERLPHSLYQLIVMPHSDKPEFETIGYNIGNFPRANPQFEYEEPDRLYLCEDNRLRLWTPPGKIENLPINEQGVPVVPTVGGYVTASAELAGLEITQFEEKQAA